MNNMKKEINSENKAKFFAQYLGQQLLHGQHMINGNLIDLIFFKDTKDKYWLELKPLSEITDEDKIKITLMFLEMESAPHENVMYCFKNSVKPLLDKVDKMQGRIVDYLRAKGYALPWMGLSVEAMVESGWIKLQEA